MNHSRRGLVLIVLTVVPVWAQGADSMLVVTGRYPLDGQALSDQMVLYFNDTVQRLPDGQPPFVFTPQLRGTFEYGDRFIAFYPLAADLKRKSRYLVTVSPELKSTSGVSVADPERQFEFPTYEVRLQNISVRPHSADGTLLQLLLTDEVPIDRLRTGGVSVVDAAGTPVPVWVDVLPLRHAYSVAIPDGTAVPVTVSVNKGIPDSRGVFQIGRRYQARFPHEKPLDVQSTTWKRTPSGDEVLTMQFSAPVNSELLESVVQWTRTQDGTAIPFEITPEGDYQVLSLECTADLASVEETNVQIAAGLYSTDLRRLNDLHAQELTRTLDQLRITYHRWEDRGVDGPALSISFNGALAADALKDRVTVTPDIGELTFESGYYRELWIHGDWKGETAYTIAFESGIEDQSGTVRLQAALNYDLGETPRAQGVAFANTEKYYFPQRHQGKLVLRSLNEDEARLTVHRMFPSNAAAAMDMLYGQNTTPEFDRRYSEKIGEISVALPESSAEAVETAVDLNEMLGASPRGVFTVQLEPFRDWENTKVLVWTDIGALAHWQQDALAIYVHNLYSLEPIAGADVTVYSEKNQIMARATTNAEGVARVNNLDSKLGPPRAAVIESASDYAFLKLEHEYTEGLPHAGFAGYDREGYDVYMYADRNLYRPGEPVHLQWIARTNYGDALADMPLQLLVYNPNGQEIQKQAVTLSKFGTGGIDLNTEETFATGRYLAELRVPGREVALQTLSFNLEEFVPNRLATTVELESAVWTAGTQQPFHVRAENLFGGPARNRKAKSTIILRRGIFTSEKWPGFHFGNDDDFEPIVRSLGEATTNDQGLAAFTFDGMPPTRATSPVNVAVRGEVQELGGRAVTDSVTATLFPSDIALGVATGSSGDNTLTVDVAAMRPDESAASLDEVTVTLERRTWHYYVRRYRGYNQPSWTQSYETLEVKSVALADGRGRTEFAVPGYGYFRVRVSAEATPQYSTRNFYKFWRRIETMDSGVTDLVTLTPDADVYQAGDSATVRIESPFGGKAVVCVQGETVYDYLTVDLVDNKADVVIPIRNDYRPNVWAQVTVVHEVDPTAGETHPFSSFAMINLPVHDPARKVTVSFPDLPDEVRPNQSVPITVQTNDDNGVGISTEVTVAAVDEGIHAILNYTSPSPFAWFDRPRAPELNRAEYYDQVAYDFDPPPIGGDVMEKRLGKDPSVGENWIKPVALWSGAVTTDQEGRVTIDFDVPEFNGQLRIVAVAAGKSASGAHSSSLYVRRPYMLRTSMPRFVLPGDEFKCSAVVFNTTAEPVTARLRWRASGALRADAGHKEVHVRAGADAQLYVDFAASPGIGQGHIDWTLEVLDATGGVIESVQERAPLPVRQPAVFQSEREMIVLQPGESRTLANTRFLENDLLEYRVTAAANPALRVQRALNDLVGYAYGCLEQTVSKCMPLYVLHKSPNLIAGERDRSAEVAQYVQAGIDRLFAMQTPSGGIGFWPGANDPYPYGSAYAAHFMAVVRKDAAFKIPQTQWDSLREYVERIAFAEDDGSASARYNRAYALFVLALDGETRAMDQVSRFDDVQMPASARHLLAAVIAMNTGDSQRARDYLEDAPVMAYEGRETSGTLHSEIRATAVELIALIEMDAPQEHLVSRMEVLTRFMDNVKYPNTQDLAFAATAVGRYIDTLEANIDSARFTVTTTDGETVRSGLEVYRDEHTAGTREYVLTNNGNAPLFVDFATAGIPAQLEIKPVVEGIDIDRMVRAGHSGRRTATKFDHGDSYVVTLHLETKETLENVVVADLLPAGFEIENPRLDDDALLAMNLQDNTMFPAHLEVRDDRLVVAFDSLGPGKYRYHYVVRSVTPGTFTWPGVAAECMYDPAVRGRSIPRTIEVD